MTKTHLLDELTDRMKRIFSGYALPNSAGALQEVKIFTQYMPQPGKLTVEDKEYSGIKGYGESDYESNFPCVIVRYEGATDYDELAMPRGDAAVRIVCAVYDEAPESDGWRSILDMQERIRLEVLEHRLLAGRYLLKMPVKSKLNDSETWPVYFGETELSYSTPRPGMGHGYVERPV